MVYNKFRKLKKRMIKMKNKVIAEINEIRAMKFEVSFECVGDIWKWLNKNQSVIGEEILEMVEDNETKEFIYEINLNKYVKKLNELKNVEVRGGIK